MKSKKNLQLYFKEIIKVNSSFRGIDKIRKNLDYACDLFVHEPKNIEEAQLGSLFILGKIENVPKNKYRNFDFLLNLLISVIKREFYSNHKRQTLEALESSLNKANLYLADFTEKGNTEWVGNLSFICGAFSKNTLHLAQTGETIIKLFREGTVSHIENKFPTAKKVIPAKTFGNIASGDILESDKLIIGSKNILDIISLSNLKELSQKTYNQIADVLGKLAEKRSNKSPLICLVIEAKTSIPEESLAKQPKLAIQREPIVKSKFKFKPKIKFRPALNFIKSFSAHLPAKQTGLRQIKKIKNYIIRTASPATAVGKSLYFKNRPAFFVSSLLTLLILSLPFFTIQKINYTHNINNFNKLSAEIEIIQKETNSALAQKEKEKARSLLKKSELLFADISQYFMKAPVKNDTVLLSKFSNLQKTYEEQQNNINNVINVKELTEVFDFTTSGYKVKPTEIEKIGDALYFFELESGILYKLKDGKLTLIFISENDKLKKSLTLEGGKLALFGQNNKVYLYDHQTEEQGLPSLEPDIAISEIKEAKSFFESFFLLNKKEKNLIKYTPTPNSKSFTGSAWLSTPLINFENIQDFAIDGSIYLLNKNGLITKYYKGEKSGQIETLADFSLGDSLNIFTGYDLKNIYISDWQNKRLIVLNKKGELVSQYKNDKFANIKDFLINEDETEAYLLSEQKVYKINL